MASCSQVAFHWQPPEPIEDTMSTCGSLTHLRKQPQQKQTDELLASIHTSTVSLLMQLSNGGEISVSALCANNAPFAKSGHIIISHYNFSLKEKRTFPYMCFNKRNVSI